MAVTPIPCLFHADQLAFKPRYEWAFGDKLDHPETTARAEGILAAIEAEATRLDLQRPEMLSEEIVQELHDPGLLALLKCAEQLRRGDTFYPAVFMRGDAAHIDPGTLNHAGAFCFDSGTPLSRETWRAALWSASCAVAAAARVKSAASPVAYALSRPPGHHATGRLFGGYCYLANTALAATYLAQGGAKVAVLDIDVHHGNGTQALFWDNPNVLTVSLHGDPTHLFPFFTGYGDEAGGPNAKGFNLNVPLPEHADGEAYASALRDTAFERIRAFDPAFLVLAAGVDTYERDPMGFISLTTEDLHRVGELVGALGYPTTVVQEGGYYTPHIGRNVTAVLLGILEGRG